MTGFEEVHGYSIELLEEKVGMRVIPKMGAVELEPAGPSRRSLGGVVVEFQCPVEQCDRLHEGFEIGGAVSPS